MSDLTTLRASCKAILARHQRGLALELPCILCGQRVRGQESVMGHYVVAHGIHPTNCDNVVDLDGFLAHLRGLLFPRGNESMHCPVCRADCGDEASLLTHTAEEGHAQWDVDTIPTLAPFCIAGVNMKEDSAEEEGDSEEEDTAHENDAAENDEGDDWGVEPAVCLLCDTVSENCLGHMVDAHGFDFRAAVRSHEGVQDMYDIIRIVNVIRKCVARGVCPFHYCSEAAEAGAEAEACRCDIAASSLGEHLRDHPLHALPRVVPSSDRELIPVLCGDAFISSVVVGGDLLAQGEEDPDYPMVPTIAEMAKKQAARGKPRDTAQ